MTAIAPSWLSSAALFCVAFGLLVAEILLSSILHVLIGPGNSAAAIALALLGLAASGIAVLRVPALRDPERVASLLPLLLALFSSALVLGVFAILAVPLNHVDLAMSRGSASQQAWRVLVVVAALAPFCAGGLVVAALLSARAGAVTVLYAADLAGAALGCLASPTLLESFGAPLGIALSGLPAAALAALAALRGPPARRHQAWLAALPLALCGWPMLEPQLLSFKRINSMGRVEAPSHRSVPLAPGDLDFERWDLSGWTILRGPRIPQQWEEFRGWGLSETYRGFVPETRLINFDAQFSSFATALPDTSAASLARVAPWLDADLGSLQHRLGRRFERALVIGAGGGREVLAALRYGARRVVAVDVNEVVIDELMRYRLRDFSGGLYSDPRVEAIADDGRSFAARSRERFDLVEFGIVGGMLLEKVDLVRVDDLFTREALDAYLARLSDAGVFSYLMYSLRGDRLDELAVSNGVVGVPYIPALRTLIGLRQALAARAPGQPFREQVLVAGLRGRVHPGYDLVHIAASPTPFSQAERETFQALCRELHFDALYPPPPGAAASLYARAIEADDVEHFSDALPFRVLPATDDAPFQYSIGAAQLARAARSGQLFAVLAGNPLISLGFSLSAVALLLVLAPLFLLPASEAEATAALRPGRSAWPLLGVFACLGYGYMAVEIGVLLQLQLFLGRPALGLSVALFSFLAWSALGSRICNRIPQASLHRVLAFAVLGIAVLGSVHQALAPRWFAAALHWPLFARAALACALLLPLALPMGLCFPGAVRLLAAERAALVPWAWAINGCFSVIGIFATRVFALFAGFQRSVWLGLAVYALIAALLPLHRRWARS